MPVARKQTPTSSSSGGVLSRAVPVSQIQGQWDRFCLYGINRVGKTTLACQWPKPLLIVAFEPNPTGGSKSVQNVLGVYHVRLTNSADGLALCNELQACGGKWQGQQFMSYVLDGATSYQDIVLMEVMGWDKPKEQLNFGTVGKERYQERAEKVKEGLRPFTNLPGHVVIIAQEKDHNPPKDDYGSVNALRGGFQTESFFASDVGGGVAKWLHDVCDYIGRLQLVDEIVEKNETSMFQGKPRTTTKREFTGKKIRRLWTVLDTHWAAGFRSSTPGKVPEYIDEPTYEKIAAIIR